jgi:hypothetical protein
MATTTNFGWETPDDTDLVKDGAAAMRTLGSSIDTSFVDLKGGTTGQFLKKASGTDLDFSWANAPGKVLQVVYASYSTSTATTSTTYSDTGLTATITPSAATSKVMILTGQTLSMYRSDGGLYSKLKLLRGATDILTIGNTAFGIEVYATGVTQVESRSIVPVNYLDSPNTTSATTYKTQFACSQQPGGPTVTITAQKDSVVSTMLLLEIGA